MLQKKIFPSHVMRKLKIYDILFAAVTLCGYERTSPMSSNQLGMHGSYCQKRVVAILSAHCIHIITRSIQFICAIV